MAEFSGIDPSLRPINLGMQTCQVLFKHAARPFPAGGGLSCHPVEVNQNGPRADLVEPTCLQNDSQRQYSAHVRSQMVSRKGPRASRTFYEGATGVARTSLSNVHREQQELNS